MDLPFAKKPRIWRARFLSGAGEMGKRIREFNWVGTPLGRR